MPHSNWNLLAEPYLDILHYESAWIPNNGAKQLLLKNVCSCSDVSCFKTIPAISTVAI